MAQKETTNMQVFSYNLFADKSIYPGNRKENNNTQYYEKTKLCNHQELIHCKKAVIASK